MTPDEVYQFQTPGGKSIDEFASAGFIIERGAGDFRGNTFTNCGFGETKINGVLDSYDEDAVILCLSTENSTALRDRLNKKVCLEVCDVEALKKAFDHQIGQVSQAGLVGYTSGDERGHFLKSDADDWQAEYRLVWPRRSSSLTVRVPLGVVRKA